MRGSNTSEHNGYMCKCYLLSLLTAMGSALYGAIYFANIINNFNNSMSVSEAKFDNNINCDGTPDDYKFGKDCPTNKPCKTDCENYYADYHARYWSIIGTMFCSVAFTSGAFILFTCERQSFIENFCNFFSNCRSELEYWSGDPPFNSGKDDQCPITLELVKNLVNPVVASDGYIYERKAIERWLALHHTSPLTRDEEMDDNLYRYDLNKESADSPQQTVSALHTSSYKPPMFTPTATENEDKSNEDESNENEGNENTFTV
jgi:hypothetical protein